MIKLNVIFFTGMLTGIKTDYIIMNSNLDSI